MKVLMVLNKPVIYDPRPYKEAKSLVENGYHVTVLAQDISRRLPKNEKRDGINIVRCSYDRAILSRKFAWWKKAYSEALKLHQDHNFDIIHCHDFDSLPIGTKLKKKLDVSLIYDSHEHFESLVNIKTTPLLSNYYIWKENQGLKHADHIITVCKPIQKHFQKKGYTNVTIIRNCKEKVSEKYIPPKNDIFTLIYMGTFNGKRFTSSAIEVCKNLDGVEFKIAGFGPKKEDIINLINDNPKKNIRFLGKIDMERVIPETLKADAVLGMYDPKFKNNKIGLPNKFFESMVCGRPYISTKNTYAGNLVEKINMGMAVNYNKKSFKDAVVKLRDNPELRERLGKNALKAALSRYNWEIEEKNLLEVYEKVIQ